MQQKEIIAKLKENIVTHLRPYNLGDMGETETLIMQLIKSVENTPAQPPVNGEEDWLTKLDRIEASFDPPSPAKAEQEGPPTWSNRANYSGDSYIGGYHWFHTLMGKVRDVGVYMQKHEVDSILRSKWGQEIQNIYSDLSEWFAYISEHPLPKPKREQEGLKWVRLTTAETLPPVEKGPNPKVYAIRCQESDMNRENPYLRQGWMTAEEMLEDCQGCDWYEYLLESAPKEAEPE